MTLTTPASPATLSTVAAADAILLDFNGTLSDDELLLAELVAEIAADELGVRVSHERYFAEFAGFTEEYMFGILAAEAGMDAPDPDRLMHRFNERYLERTAEHSTITPAARGFVRAAQRAGKRLAVVTAASRDTVVPALRQAGLLDAFDAIVALEDVAASKPAPDCYLRALTELGVSAERAVAFEDSRTGIAAATGAQIETIAVLGSLDEGAAGALTPHVVPGLAAELLPGSATE